MLKEKYKSLEAELAKIKKELAIVEAEILKTHDNELKSLLASKKEPFGLVHLDDFDVTIPKKVKYDMDGLASLYHEIGEDADEYIDVKYSVSETKYKNWPSAIQKEFLPYRTVEQGKPQIKVRKDA